MFRRVVVLSFFIHGGCFAAKYGQISLPFERSDPPGAFVSRGSGLNLLVSKDGAAFALGGKPSAVVYMRVVGSSPVSQVVGQEELSSHGNYLIGRNPSAWRTNVTQFGSVRVVEILPHTDFVYYGGPERLEYDMLLRPGADIGRIRLRFEGGNVRTTVDNSGNLVLKTEAGEIIEHKPQIEQDGKSIDGRFAIEANGDVRFRLGSYNRRRPLRIDPVISYSTYLGGTVNDSPNAIAVDAAGNAYITGATSSFNFPVTPGALQPAFPSANETVAFVAKLNPTGTGLVYTTFLGGSGVNGGDSANAIAVDASGNAYIAGTTGSANFPVTQGAISSTLSGPIDAFVGKINPTGTALVFGTYLGGAGTETAAGLAVDATGIYVTGSTSSANFPVTSGAPQRILKSVNDAFVAKLNPTGTALIYSTYLGGSAEDDGYAIAIDGAGSAYVTGSTASTDFPVTSGALKTAVGPSPMAFAVKVNAAGTSFSYATFLGGTGGDSGNAIAVDSSGDAYVAGTTFSADFPTTTGVIAEIVPGAAAYGHAFLAKLNPTGAGLAYSTYLGGANADGAKGLALDTYGNATMTGFTNSANFPVTANPAEPVANFNPAGFLTTINQSGTALIYSTMLGATGSTVASAVALDATNHAYVAGYTGSLTLPGTPGDFQSYNATSNPLAKTGFAMKLDLGSAVSCSLAFSPGSLTLPATGGALTASVVAPTGCAWEATPGSSWVSVNLPSSGVGPGIITVTATSNQMSLSSRSAVVNAGSASLTVTQAAGSCSAPLFYPATQAFGAAGGTGSVAVSLPSACPVTAVSSVAWITINSGASATGDDLVTFTVAADAGAARSGTIAIAGTAYTLSQSGSACVTSLTASGSSITAAGGSLTASLVAPAGCAWTVTSSASWLTVSPVSGTGSGSLTLTAVANATGSALSATVTAAGLSVSITQAASVPTADSVTPNVSVGTSQVFTAVYSDTAGASALNNRYFLINSALYGGSACFVEILPTGIYLYDDDVAPTLLGPIAPGGTYANKQCTLNGTGSGLSNAGNSATVTLSIAFKSAFNGLKNIYMYDDDISGANSQWQVRGTYTVGLGTPAVVSVTPNTGVGTNQVFTAVYSDNAGAGALNNRYFLINSSLYGGSACFIEILPAGIYLYDDDTAPTLLGPIVPGGTYANKQCTLNGTGSGVSNAGNSATVTLSIAFKSAFNGLKNIYMYDDDFSGANSQWQVQGTYTIGPGIPTADSVTPSVSVGTSQVFTAVYSDTAGASALNNRYFLINSALYGGSACFVEILPTGIYLYDDDVAPTLLGPIAPGGTYANKQCTLNGTGSGLSNAGNSATVTLSIAFKSAFNGLKNIYMYDDDISGANSQWQVRGTYTVGLGTPAVVSVTPNAGVGTNQVFTAVYSDNAGAGALNNRYFLINSSLYGGSACFIEILPAGIYLYDDDTAPTLLGPIVPGGTYANKQCTLNGTGSGVSNAGNSATVTLSIAFKSAFNGLKNIYMYDDDFSGANSQWQVRGTYTIHP